MFHAAKRSLSSCWKAATSRPRMSGDSRRKVRGLPAGGRGRPGSGSGIGLVAVVAAGARRPRGAQALVPDPRTGQHVVRVALRRGARAVVGDHAGAQPHPADVAREELEADADVGARLPAAAELVGAVLQAGARQLHRADALVAEPLAAVAQVPAVVVRGHGEQARRAGS